MSARKSQSKSHLKNANVYARIYALVKLVPPGQVATYGHIASMTAPCSARQVGYAMSHCPDGENIPWQRIVNRAGQVSERSAGGDATRQRKLLIDEGIAFDKKYCIDFEQYGWMGPDWDWVKKHGYQWMEPPWLK